MSVSGHDPLSRRSKRLRRRRIAHIALALGLDASRVSSPAPLLHFQTSCKHSMFSGFKSETLLTPSSRMAIMISLSITRAVRVEGVEGRGGLVDTKDSIGITDLTYSGWRVPRLSPRKQSEPRGTHVQVRRPARPERAPSAHRFPSSPLHRCTRRSLVRVTDPALSDAVISKSRIQSGRWRHVQNHQQAILEALRQLQRLTNRAAGRHGWKE
jgi:hypothetical protein